MYMLMGPHDSRTCINMSENFKANITRTLQYDGLVDVIIYSSPDDPKKKNRGFAFLEYDSHKSASLAKHKIGNGWMRVWGCDIIVDWADPLEEPDDEIMNKVKVLYVRNLKSNVTDDQLRAAFEKYGKVERVKKVKDYSFVHFEDRNQALQAMEELQGKKIGDSEMQISLAKPPSENKQKEKRRQQFKHLYVNHGDDDVMVMMRCYDDSYIPSQYYGGSSGGGGPGGVVPLRGMSRSARPPFLFRGGFRSHIPTVDYYARDYRGGSYTDDYDYYPTYEAEDYLNYAASYPDGRGRALVRGGATGGITAAVAGGGAGVAATSGGHVSAPSIRGHLPLWPMYGQPQQPQWPPGRNVPGALQWSPTRR
ncbi:hypothetical protein HELRODRAFT_167246 [Helobdella robusta]|uniref:RRM domain-containing protein n=1 Tax=Helobdella robusta TaxID=6412 RepID=T1EZ62_HELRO|nr:hypothetical protein HELRODRAFT_167246 [Helobdella robusta]ESO10750.1 hypothetical protein HELRODRAFT_167246 [Helobdella robusta]